MSQREQEAASWFARMRGPDAKHHRAAFDVWRSDPANDAAYRLAEEDWLIVGGISREHVAARGETRTAARSAPMRWAIAAALVLALGLAGAWHLQSGSASRVALDRTPAPDMLRLADGSQVLLMDGARIETRFGATRRNLILTGGRARFTVAHDASRPFTVFAGASETRALGTIFEVDLRAGAPRIHLIEGSVEVGASGNAMRVRLTPGERAEVAGGEARRVTTAADKTATTMLDADDLPLAAVIERANRSGAIPIRLVDPALGARRVTGRFDIGDSGMLAKKLAAALALDMTATSSEIFLGARAKNTGG